MVAAGSVLLALFRRHLYVDSPAGQWSQVVLPGDGVTQAFGVTEGTPIVAVGCAECSPSLADDGHLRGPATHGAVWSTEDGLVWRITDLGPGVFLASVASGGAGYAALGEACVEGSATTDRAGNETCHWQRSIWTSRDALEWTRSDLDVLWPFVTEDLVVTDSETIVLGRKDEGGQRVIWRLANGGTWVPTILAWTPGTYGFTTSAAAFGARVVQVGAGASGNANEKAAAWVFDGSEWIEAPAQDTLKPGWMADVVLAGGELIAVGILASRPELPLIWSSTDGLSWSAVQPPPTGDETIAAVESAGDGGVLLRGSRGTIWAGKVAAPGSVAAPPTPSPAPRPSATPRRSAQPTPQGELPPYVRPNCRPEIPEGWSIARYWDERVLDLVRVSPPNPAVHARNLFHVSAAMWDAWAAYDDVAEGYVTHEKHAADDTAAARNAAISYAAYGVLKWRYFDIGTFDPASQGLERTLERLCYEPGYDSAGGDTPADLGNRIAQAVIDAGRHDGARERDGYFDSTYSPLNDPLVVAKPGADLVDPNRWQPIKLPRGAQTQGGRPAPSGPQTFIGAGWGWVKPFAIPASSKGVPIDPGPQPRLGDASTDAELKDELVALIRYSAGLDIRDGEMVDISPGALGNNALGANDGQGHALNPATGLPYEPDLVRNADFQRALAEFWADGPSSETPPGHWNVIANAVADAPGFSFRQAGDGPVMDRLAWDVKMYFALNGAVHDAAVSAWGLKRYYDSARPISLIRYMAGRGQSSDPEQPSYHPLGLPLVPGLIELITAASSAPGERHEHLAAHVGEMAVRSWLGFPASPRDEISGVGWKLGETWVPYQRVTFVTPAFPGYVSGHSTFSRAAAEVLTAMTGSEFFPGGLQTWTTYIGDLRHELGPTTDVTLQWATYYDAADLAGMSRLYMGIHIKADDFEGRRLGATCGRAAWDLAARYFDGSAREH